MERKVTVPGTEDTGKQRWGLRKKIKKSEDQMGTIYMLKGLVLLFLDDPQLGRFQGRRPAAAWSPAREYRLCAAHY